VEVVSVDTFLDQQVDRAIALGIRSFLLFGVPSLKDDGASESFSADGVVQRALRRFRSRGDDVVLISDVCACAYTDHGHCGIVVDGRLDNDETLELLGRIAVSHAEAGAHVVAPSAAADGMVAAIREDLDRAGFADTAIMSYAVKYASAYYGPFRDAAHSAPAFGDRRTYQMNPANRREALAEARLDQAEGADLLIVKPALPCLDIISAVRRRSRVPVVGYSVSGEYAMIKAAAQNGWIDERRVVLESLTAIRRAGADAVITYHATDVAQWLREEQGR
jgi:porphobilinogen synthase